MTGTQWLHASIDWLRGRSPKRLVVLGATLVVALVFVGSALAVVTYKNGYLGPDGFATTSGYNYRDWNRAAFCDSVSIEYKAAVGYYNADMTLMHYSGVVYTNCYEGSIAALENNGYYRSRCWNKDNIGGNYLCQTDP